MGIYIYVCGGDTISKQPLKWLTSPYPCPSIFNLTRQFLKVCAHETLDARGKVFVGLGTGDLSSLGSKGSAGRGKQWNDVLMVFEWCLMDILWNIIVKYS